MGKSTAIQQTATGRGRIVSGSLNQIVEGGAIGLGAGAKYQETGAISAGGAVNLGTQLGAIGSGATVTIGDPNAARIFADTVAKVTEQNTAAMGSLLARDAGGGGSGGGVSLSVSWKVWAAGALVLVVLFLWGRR